MKLSVLDRISASRRKQCPSCRVQVKGRAAVCVNCGQELGGEKGRTGSVAAGPRPARG